MLGGVEGVEREGVTSTQHMTGAKLASQLASFLTRLESKIEQFIRTALEERRRYIVREAGRSDHALRTRDRRTDPESPPVGPVS